jgi:tetratricopeptide (TPR) repeat protein
MTDNLAQKAIAQALKGNWKDALETNELILKKTPDDTDALVRLSKCYAELGKYKIAKQIAKKVLAIDPFNSIAKRSMDKWQGLKDGEVLVSNPLSAKTFLEEPGKTKVVNLLHVCSGDILAKLDAGDEVKINDHGHRITIFSIDGKKIGKLPDDLSANLKNLISKGNEYRAYVKSVDNASIKILIRETKQSEKCKNIQSFPPEKIDYISFTPPELVHKKEDIDVETYEEKEESAEGSV